jgi:MFS family permease
MLQASVPSQKRGRVFVGYDMIWPAGRLASLIGGGLTADALGIRAVYLLGGILLLLAGALPLRRLGSGPCGS